MFQLSGMKFLLFFTIVLSLGLLWYLDTKYYHWDRILPEPEDMVIGGGDEPESPANDTTFKLKEFVPTNEWQIIENGQSIPAGLHVQIDLSTGVKKAKLMEGNVNGKTNSLAIIHDNETDNIGESMNIPPVDEQKFKSYKEIKEDLKTMNMSVQSDMEVMNELSIKFKEQLKLFEDSSKNVKNILTDLEYLLHQVDTAEVFVQNKGIESIVIPCIDSNSSFMKAQGALILGSAASNNQKVQIAALKSGILKRLLSHINEEYSFSVQKNCLYAVSTISRRFPLAQQQILDDNGIQTFMSVFKRPQSDLNMKLKVRVSQLLEDLILEIEDAKLTLQEEKNNQLDSEAKERVRQYDNLHLKNKLSENGWCEILRDEFVALSNLLPMTGESHDMVEASGKSLLAMKDLCKAKLKGNKQLFNSLYVLESHYKKLFKKDNFFNLLYQLVSELTNTYDPVLE